MVGDLFNNVPGVKFHKTAFVVVKKVEKDLQSEVNLTFPQFMVLAMLSKKEHCKQVEMAEHGHLTEAAISRMIEGMVEKKLVVRKENPESRREHLIEMTEAGKSQLNMAMKIVTTSMKEVFGVLSEVERTQLDTILDKILGYVYTVREIKNYA